MWINGMLTIWAWGTVFSLVLIAFSLWKWYRPDSNEGRKDND